MSEASYVSSDDEKVLYKGDEDSDEKVEIFKNDSDSENFEGQRLKSGNIMQIRNEGSLSSISKSDSFVSSDCALLPDDKETEEEYDFRISNAEFVSKKNHFFVLSTAGKPIYSLNGSEDKLATIFGLLQALVSFVQAEDDTLRSIKAHNMRFVFQQKGPLILVAVTKAPRSIHQIQMQLNNVYNQIISIVTLSQLNHVYQKRNNYDLRKMLAGSERLIDHLLSNDKAKKISNTPFVFLTNSVRTLPLDSSVRDTISSAIQTNCSKIKNLVFAILIAKNKLITLVQMKNYIMHTDDLRLILNLIECTESFKSAESWTPICLPKFDSNGFLHGHVSYLSEDCEACLMLLSVDSEQFFALSEAKKKIIDKLRRTNCLEAINEAMKNKGISLKTIGVSDMRHFLYKSKKNAQLLCSEITIPYNKLDAFERLENLYCEAHQRLTNAKRPLKLIYDTFETETILAWNTAQYDLYAVFDPILDREKSTIIAQVNKLLKHIDKEKEKLFMMNSYNFKN